MSNKASHDRSSSRSRRPVASGGDIPGAQRDDRGASPPSAPRAVLTFLADWQEHRDADPAAGGLLALAYAPERLAPHDDTQPSIVGYARFLPGGQLRTAALRDPAPQTHLDGAPPARLAAGEILVPDDAKAVELWFERTGGDGLRWDSRFGQNYRFPVAAAAVTPSAASGMTSADSADGQGHVAKTTVELRRGARRAPVAVRVLADGAVKQNVLPSRPGYSTATSNLQTHLRVTARVRAAGDAANVWADVHVLDHDGDLLHAVTLPFRYDRASDDGGSYFVLESPLYQGAIASPGSVSPRPDARAVEYRVYAESDGRVRTDGLVHRCELKSDSGSGYETPPE